MQIDDPNHTQEDSLITRALSNCKTENHWSLSNQILYDLCSKYPDHRNPEEIVAKVLMIGRIYAVALERIKTKLRINDDFYLEAIVPLFQRSNLDQRLGTLRGKSLSDQQVFEETLQVHSYLIKLIGGLESDERYLKKRSFASKYLHFHLPDLFFIYDSRAQNAMTLFNFKPSHQIKELVKRYDLDEPYAQFAERCIKLKKWLVNQDLYLNNREVDNLLLYIGNEHMKNKRTKSEKSQVVAAHPQTIGM